MRAAADRRGGNGVVPAAAASAGGGVGGLGGASGPVKPSRSLGPRRRRPALIALSVTLIAAGGLGSAAFYASRDSRISVLAVAHDVAQGQTVRDSDVREVSITPADGLDPVRARDRAEVVGHRAAVALHPGTLLSRSQLTDQLTLKPGDILVGVAVTTTHMPAEGLQPGMQVLVVSTPRKNDDPPAIPPRTIRATVVQVGKTDTATSTVVVDVAVPAVDGAALAARAFTERVAIVVIAGASDGGGGGAS